MTTKQNVWPTSVSDASSEHLDSYGAVIHPTSFFERPPFEDAANQGSDSRLVKSLERGRAT